MRWWYEIEWLRTGRTWNFWVIEKFRDFCGLLNFKKDNIWRHEVEGNVKAKFYIVVELMPGV